MHLTKLKILYKKHAELIATLREKVELGDNSDLPEFTNISLPGVSLELQIQPILLPRLIHGHATLR